MKNLNVYVADLGVTYIKLHNLHWNVTGFAFKQVHEFLEALYDDRTEKFDEVAEAIKMREEFPPASLKEFLELTQIEELPVKDYTNKEAIEIVLKDVEKTREFATELRNKADEAGDFTLVAMLEDHVAGYDKEIWFMKSMLK
ncbi:MAG: DNA starvation/stationary phase protection protein [Tissierellia bacterium]|nr:DNA starvation/stationary phase protection protein [Tissierellia bacterium]